MNNPYHQFNIRPRANPRLDANTPSNGFESYNLRNPPLGTVRLLSPTVAGENQRMYNALYSNTPQMPPVNGTMGFNAVNQTAYGQWVGLQGPRYMTNYNPGIAPVIPVGVGNQPSGLPCTGMNMQANDLLQQYISGYAAVLGHRMPVSQVASLQQTVLPGVAVIPSSLGATDDMISPANNPFREVQWVPPGVQQTGIPLVPYALEIKPDSDKMPNNQVPFGSPSRVNAASTVVGSISKTEQNAPAVYLDIAMDSSSNSFDANSRPVVIPSIHREVAATNVARNPVKRKRNQSKGNSSSTSVNVYDKRAVNARIRQCVVSLVPIDSIIVSSFDNNNDVEEDSVDSPSALIASPVSETQELYLNEDTPVPASLDYGSEPSSQELSNNREVNEDMPALVNGSVVEPYNDKDIPIPVVEVNTNLTLAVSVVEENAADRSDSGQPTGNDEGVERATEANTSLNNAAASTDKNTSEDDSGQLIGSDEDVGGEDDNRMSNEDSDSEKSVCYEVVHKDSDTVLFDMECDGDKDSETLRVLLPTKKRKTTTTTENTMKAKTNVSKAALPLLSACVETSETLRVPLPTKKRKTTTTENTMKAKTTVSKAALPLLSARVEAILRSMKRCKPKELPKHQASNVPVVIPVDVDIDTSDDVVFVKSVTASENNATTRSDEGNVKDASGSERLQRLAANACKEKLSAAGSQLDCIQLKKSDNSLLGVPLQCSFFRFETQCSEVFRLLSMERSYVPDSVLAPLMNLVLSVGTTAVDGYCSSGNASSGAVCRIPQGGRRKILFQCLFCPYSELSAKRVMTHVKQQHRKYASFIQRKLLPSRHVMLFIYCRHCNFIGYDGAALLIHFAVYHKVPGILLSKPWDIEQDPDWVPVFNPETRARVFPFYCCPNCIYIDVEWNRIIQHMLKMHYSESVYMGCVVRLVMVGRASRHLSTFTYASLAKNEECKVARKDIYACVSCKFFSFYPTYAFCHYVANHGGIEMLYMCAASPTCTKRYTYVDEVISHIQDVHVAMRKLQFQCTVTLLDGLTSTELDIGPGELNISDVPLHVSFQAASVRSCPVTTAIEIVDDDSDDDVMFLGSERKDNNELDDVEPDEPNRCCDVPANTEPSSPSIVISEDESRQEPSDMNCSSQEPPVTEKLTEAGAEENIEPYAVSSDACKTSAVMANDTTRDLVDSVFTKEDHWCDTEQVLELNCEAVSHAEEESLQTAQSDLQIGNSAGDIDETESQSVEKAVFMRLSDLVNTVVDSELAGQDRNPQPACDETVTDVISQTSVSSGTEISAPPESTQSSVEGTCQTDNSAEDSTSSTETTNQPADTAVLVCDANVLSNSESFAEYESVKNPVSRPNETRSIDDTTFICEELKHPACDETVTDVISQTSVSSGTEISAPPESTQSSVEGTCQTDNSAEDSTSSTETTNQPADAADLVSHANVSSNNENFAEYESVTNPVSGPNETRSIDDTTFICEELKHPQAASVDLVNHASIRANGDTAADMVSAQDGVCAWNEVDNSIANPQLNDVADTERELFNFDQPNNVDVLNVSLSLSDTLPNIEISESPSDQPERLDCSAVDMQEELLLLAEQLTADEPWNGDKMDQTESCSVVSSVKSVAEDTADFSDIICMETPSLEPDEDLSNDTFCNNVLTNEQLNTPMPPEPNAVDDSEVVGQSADSSLPSDIDCSSKLPPETMQSEVSKQSDSVNNKDSDADAADKPVSVNRLRFKSLAGFRISPSCSGLADPKSE